MTNWNKAAIVRPGSLSASVDITARSAAVFLFLFFS
jgi:hypothetical protein